MSKKVKKEVVRKIENKEAFDSIICEENNKKIIVVNIYDKFWGTVEIADKVIERFNDNNPKSSSIEFVAADKTLFDAEFIKKYKIQSKPVYLIYLVC